MIIKREKFIDYLRGFIVLLMALDHALHAYGYNWGRFWFFRDYDRSVICDGFYLFNQSIIMPMLFFTIGFYVLPKVQKNGFKVFWKDRVIKYFIPFLIGIPLFVPLLTYPRFFEYTDSSHSFYSYYNSIFWSKLQAGPFWVMYATLLYTFLLLALHWLFPKLIPILAKKIKRSVYNPGKYFFIFFIFSAFIYGLSDLLWGAPWWIGFLKIFYLQGSKFIMNFVYFVLGAAFYCSGIYKDRHVWKKVTERKDYFLILTVMLGALYAIYSINFIDSGAYSENIIQRLHFKKEIWGWLFDVAPMVLIRTSLLSMLVMLQMLTLIAFFGNIGNKNSQKTNLFWGKIAQNCYGIFILHESITVWGQFFFIDYDISIILKIMIIFIASVSVSFIIVEYLQKIPLFKKVLELD